MGSSLMVFFGRQMRRRVLGHGGKCVRVSGGEKVTWKCMRACQRLMERCSAHRQVELVVPLLLVLVLGAEKLADARVVCLRDGGWVSSAEGRGLPYRPNGCRS